MQITRAGCLSTLTALIIQSKYFQSAMHNLSLLYGSHYEKQHFYSQNTVPCIQSPVPEVSYDWMPV